MGTTPTLQQEVSFISGVNPDGTIAATSFKSWNYNTPATYSSYSSAQKWGGTTAGSSGGTVTYYFDPNSNWSATEQSWLAAGLALWSAVANITFVQSTGTSGQIDLTRGTDGGAETYTNYRTTGTMAAGSTTLATLTGATVSIDTRVGGFGPINGFSSYGGYPLETLIHEEGHALGLGHAGAYNGAVNVATQQYSAYDTRQWSLMSYIDPTATGTKYQSQYTSTANYGGTYPTTPMVLDIAAIQELYGTPVNTPLSGGQTFGFNCNVSGAIEPFFDFTKNTKPVISIYDEGTNNTLDLSGFSQASTVNLNAGDYSSVDGLTNNIGIAFGTAIDKLVLGSGGGSVTCNSDGDTIVLGKGNDTVTGGTGNDTAVFSGACSSYTLVKNTDGSISVTGAGTDKLTGVENLQFTDKTILATSVGSTGTGTGTGPVTSPGTGTLAPRPFTDAHDFNGDGKSDILVMANDGSSAQIYFMSGLTPTSSATIAPPASSGWAAVATGDFNGDGKADIVWQNTSTQDIEIYEMNGASTLATGTLSPGAGWAVVGKGDFNGDKQTDLVLQNGSQIEILLMSGLTQLAGSGVVSTAIPSGDRFVAAGDFNGDGKADILLENTSTRQLQIWMMNGSTRTSTATTTTVPGAGWTPIDTGDYNGDGKTDVLWQNTTTGQGAVWVMNGAQYGSGGGLSVVAGAGWQIMGSGDYNGDGKSDILYRNTGTGAMGVWEMSGTTYLLGSGSIGVNPGTSFHAVAG